MENNGQLLIAKRKRRDRFAGRIVKIMGFVIANDVNIVRRLR